MQDMFQEIEVRFRNRLKEIPTNSGTPLLETESHRLDTRTRDNLWAIEHDTVKARMKLQQGMKHRAPGAADIGHSAYTTCVDESCRFLCDSGCQTRHRLGEGGGLSGVCRKIFKQPRPKRWNRLAFSRFDSLSEAREQEDRVNLDDRRRDAAQIEPSGPSSRAGQWASSFATRTNYVQSSFFSFGAFEHIQRFL
jgi:hypothetical protein